MFVLFKDLDCPFLLVSSRIKEIMAKMTTVNTAEANKTTRAMKEKLEQSENQPEKINNCTRFSNAQA
jgi:hypothetical protein